METVKEKIEKWLNDAPKEVFIERIEVTPNVYTKLRTGKLLPILVDNGYDGSIYFTCTEYEEKNAKDNIRKSRH